MGSEGERGGEKGWEERGPKAHSKKLSGFGSPVVWVLFRETTGALEKIKASQKIVRREDVSDFHRLLGSNL